MNSGDYASAIESFKEVLRNNPSNAEALDGIKKAKEKKAEADILVKSN